MSKLHIEFQVEEASMETALQLLLPRLVADRATWQVNPYNGKDRLLRELPSRLVAYGKRFATEPHLRVVVLVDSDGKPCVELKTQVEHAAREAGVVTKSAAPEARACRALTRVVVQELEAWFFGDPDAIRAAFPKVTASLAGKRAYRDPDAIPATWEKLHRVLVEAGHYGKTYYPKIEVARRIAGHLAPERNRSRSFQAFRTGLETLLTSG